MINCQDNSLKVKQQLLLLRRPLPPKLPKLPLHKKKIHSAVTDETTSTSVKSKRGLVLDVISTDDSQRPISIPSIFFDPHPQSRPPSSAPFPKPAGSDHWNIPHSAVGSMFFPSCRSASLRVFRKTQQKRRRLRKSKKRRQKKEQSGIQFGNMLVISSRPLKPSIRSVTKLKTISPEFQLSPVSPDYSQGRLPSGRDLSVALLSPVPSSTSIKPEEKWTPRPLKKFAVASKVVLSMAKLPVVSSLPQAVLPRKPQRQAAIESVTEITKNGKAKATVTPKPSEAVIRSRRLLDPDAHVLRGEGFNTVAATRYETIIAVSNLAIINCQIHGRNALNLMGFFLLQCPDLTPVAFQLIYLNLSFNHLTQFPTEIFCLTNLQILKLRNNPIKEIPDEIYQLKFLRSFTIAFNKISTIPLGLCYLHHLEEFDISYNEITVIPNEIQKLRSLDRLIVDGNYMVAFPPGILKLNLTKIQFENTFTSHYFWAENSLNTPQRLTQIIPLFIIKNNLLRLYPKIPNKLQKFFKSTSRCDWCHGPRFGEGYRVIRSCDMFGVTQLPVMFHVCSPTCFVDLRESSYVLEGFPSRRIPLNMDWVEERKYSDVSIYL